MEKCSKFKWKKYKYLAPKNKKSQMRHKMHDYYKILAKNPPTKMHEYLIRTTHFT